MHVDAANAVDRSMQDWTGCSAPFGGKVVVFMGDFQQLLPVVRGNALHTPANLHRLSTSLFATTHFDNNAHTASPHHLSCFAVRRSSLQYFARLLCLHRVAYAVSRMHRAFPFVIHVDRRCCARCCILAHYVLCLTAIFRTGGSGDSATLMKAVWWPSVRILHFTHNFRSNADYSALLVQVGTGQLQDVTVPPDAVVDDLDDFCCRVIGADVTVPKRHVICLTLEDAATINSRVITQMAGRLELAVAGDVKINCRDPDTYSDEFLQSLQIPGAPPAVLELKVGAR